MKRWTVYCHTHIESGRRYIGLTSKTMLARWNDHVYKAKSSKGGRWHFPNAIRKYGKDAFSHEILAVCDSLEEANRIEKDKIDEYKTRDPGFGFNLAPGGEHKPHPIRKNPWGDPTYREKAIARSREMWRDPAFRAANLPKLKDALAASMTPDARKTHAEACSAPEVVAKRRQSAQKQMNDPKNRFALADKMRGVPLSDESRAKIAAANRLRVVSEETRAKLSSNSAFRTLAPEARAKSAASHRLLPKKTHCKHGHSLADAHIRPNGERVCRVCSRARDKRRREASC